MYCRQALSRDASALSSSDCTLQIPHDRAIAHVRNCHHAKSRADGCNFFHNQTILEKANETCLFLGQTCALGGNSAVAFDTSFIDAKYLGINAAKRYQFRRKTRCAPLVPDSVFTEIESPPRMDSGKRVEVPPPNLRGICQMGKFKSVGWRNVSFWGLVGLLSLCGAVSLASVATEDEELWLIVGVRLLTRAIRGGMRWLKIKFMCIDVDQGFCALY